MAIVLVILLAHSVSALSSSVPPPQQACVSLTVTTTTTSFSREHGWIIDDGSQGLFWSGSSSGSDDYACIGSASCTQSPFTHEICLGIGNHTITLTDSWGDGWETGSHVKIGRVDNGPGPILPMTAVPNPTNESVSGYDRTETFYVSAPHPLPPPSQLPPPSPPNLPGARTIYGLSLELTVSYPPTPELLPEAPALNSCLRHQP